MPWRLEPGADLMFSMHLRPTGRPERVQASIGLYFTDTAPAAAPVTLRLGRQDIDIPAGSSAYTIANQYQLPVDVALHSVYPHAHHLARRMEAWAVRPDGVRMPLLLIADWDFNWQDVYRYREPVPLPAGTVLHLHYTYDNSGHRQHGGGAPRRVTFFPTAPTKWAIYGCRSFPRCRGSAACWCAISSGSCCPRRSPASR